MLLCWLRLERNLKTDSSVATLVDHAHLCMISKWGLNWVTYQGWKHFKHHLKLKNTYLYFWLVIVQSNAALMLYFIKWPTNATCIDPPSGIQNFLFWFAYFAMVFQILHYNILIGYNNILINSLYIFQKIDLWFLVVCQYTFLKRKSKEIRIPLFMQNSKYSFGLKCTSKNKI